MTSPSTFVAILIAFVFAGACSPRSPSPDDPPTNNTPGEDADTDANTKADTDADTKADTEANGQDDRTVTVLTTGLRAPWDIAFTPDGRVFLTERDAGVVSRMDDDGRRSEVRRFDVDSAGEGGLMGLTTSPHFEEDGMLYVYYTSSEDNRIVRFRPDDDDEPETVLAGIPKARIHNGGRIDFGPDDMLYAGTGDAGNPSSSQDPDSLAGKILRMTPDGGVPDDNPNDGSLVYAMGLRNVQGLAWDASGRLYATEFGPQVDDEINLIEAGANYGWPEVTGEASTDPYVDPVVIRQPPVASWSGATFLENDLYVAALRGQRLWRFAFGGDGREVVESEELLAEEYGRLRHVTVAPDGSLRVLTNNRDGRGQPIDDDDRILRIGLPALEDSAP